MSLPKPYYQDKYCTIYCGDARDIVPLLAPVELTITDPPYGVNGAKGLNAFKEKCTYGSSFPDTPEYIRDVVVPIIIQCRSISQRMIITPGLRCNHFYPQPNDIGAFFHNASTTWSYWGHLTTSLIYYYGKDPRQGIGQSPNGRYLNEAAPKNTGHPCPKPVNAWAWLLNKGSLPGETVLDPFMGSGTTLRVAKDLNRKAIGIEIEEKYCKIAVERLQQEVLELK